MYPPGWPGGVKKILAGLSRSEQMQPTSTTGTGLNKIQLPHKQHYHTDTHTEPVLLSIHLYDVFSDVCVTLLLVQHVL